jgi:hypothetical protein
MYRGIPYRPIALISVAVQKKVDRYRDKNQHLVVCITGEKLQLMYQQREKGVTRNAVWTSSGKHQRHFKIIIAASITF